MSLGIHVRIPSFQQKFTVRVIELQTSQLGASWVVKHYDSINNAVFRDESHLYFTLQVRRPLNSSRVTIAPDWSDTVGEARDMHYTYYIIVEEKLVPREIEPVGLILLDRLVARQELWVL